MTKRSDESNVTAISVAYAVTLALMGVASLFPGVRLWGLNGWAFQPAYAGIAAIAVGVGVWTALFIRRDRLVEGQAATSALFTVPAAVVVTLLSGVLFFILRGQYHYLGDGYSLLANLGSPSPIVKPREIGAEWVNGVV
ncbi:MAG TPA: hypothetical protein VMS71_08415, partial [Candidatus Acidoferrum sp.]|nr:hypothetical protein [Candidatus Acidoferrum sp.]